MTKFALLTTTTVSILTVSLVLLRSTTIAVSDTNIESSSAEVCANGADGAGGCLAVGSSEAGHHSLLALKSKVKRQQLPGKKKRASLAQARAAGSTWRSQLTLKGKDRAYHQLQAGSVAAAHYKAAMAVGAKARKAWLQTTREEIGHVAVLDAKFNAFIESLHGSESACHSKVLSLFKGLQELTAHAKALSEQQIAHQTVLTSATADLHATDEAIADAKKVHEEKLAACEQDRADAAAKFVEYTNELEELAQIGNPEVRAQMAAAHVHARLAELGGLANASYGAGADGAEAGDFAAAADAAAGDEEAAAAASLLETGSSKRVTKKKAAQATSSWSKKQCLAFLRFKASTRHHARQPNATAGNETVVEEAAPVVDTCETDLASLELKFQESYSDLTELKALKLQEKDSTQCDEMASSELDAEIVPLTTQREHATDKIEDSEGAAAAMQPVIEMMRTQVETLKAHVAEVKEECTEAQACESHLHAVAELIESTINCPGVEDVYLPTPKDVCHTNGLTCSWQCSDKGSIFKTGLEYGHYEVLTNVPTMNEIEGRAFCQMHCIQDVHCVGFTFHVDAGECLMALDVLDGEFSQAPSDHQEHTVYSCFVTERQALVDRFRDPTKPTLTLENLSDHWCEFNHCEHGEAGHFDNHGLDDECHDFCEHAGDALSEEFHAEPHFEDHAHHTDIDACGCAPSTGWCAEHGSCEAEKTTEADEAACCAEGKKMLSAVAGGNGTAPTLQCVDSCGCPAGQGWCAEHGACEEGKETSAEEEACCFVGMAPQKSGDETTCFDACGCPPGSGWCSDHKQCEASAHTDDNEAACCQDGKVPGHDAEHHATCTAVATAEEATSAEAGGNVTAVF